jgi:hypothetical protein
MRWTQRSITFKGSPQMWLLAIWLLAMLLVFVYAVLSRQRY